MFFTLLLNYGFPTENTSLFHRVDKGPKNKSRYITSLRAKDKKRESKNPWGRDHTSPLPPAVTECFQLKLTRS